MQIHFHLIADMNRQRKEIAAIAFIHIRHRHLEIAGISVRIPAGGDIKPRVQGRHDRQPHDHDPGNRILSDFFEISGKNSADIGTGVLEAAQSALPCRAKPLSQLRSSFFLCHSFSSPFHSSKSSSLERCA